MRCTRSVMKDGVKIWQCSIEAVAGKRHCKKHRDQRRAYYAENREKDLSKLRVYRAENPWDAKASDVGSDYKRRCKKYDFDPVGFVTGAQLEYLARNNHCAICDGPINVFEKTNWDHIIAVRQGGCNWPYNLHRVHANCHRKVKNHNDSHIAYAIRTGLGDGTPMERRLISLYWQQFAYFRSMVDAISTNSEPQIERIAA